MKPIEMEGEASIEQSLIMFMQPNDPVEHLFELLAENKYMKISANWWRPSRKTQYSDKQE